MKTAGETIKSHVIQTMSGRMLNVFDENNLDQISVTDIAHGLAHTARWSGQTYQMYSVAQHCVNVSRLVWRATDGDPCYTLQALLHDAAEAFLGDLPSPIKHHPLLAGFRQVEGTLLRRIFFTLGCPWPMSEIVDWADNVLLHCEGRILMNAPEWAREEPVPECVTLYPWSPEKARNTFLNDYYRLKSIIIEAHKAAATILKAEGKVQ